MALLDVTVNEGMSAVTAVLDDGLAHALGSDRAARWRVDREGYRPEVALVAVDGVAVAAVMVCGRPATAATKVVDLWVGERAPAGAAQTLVDLVERRARARGDVAIKWELPPDARPVSIAAAAFAELRTPWGAAGTEGARGLVRWLAPIPHAELGYYGQTTLFTCGAVAALIAGEAAGQAGFSGSGDDRDLEIAFWRSAANFPACEPVGLAVATREHVGDRAVEVALDAEGPVLLEDFDGFDRSFRAELQAESLRRAGTIGIPVRRDRVEMAEVARRVAAGDVALLLIDEQSMHGDAGPHWIVAHASDGRDVVIVEDPWVNQASGETWVDTHELPIRLADLDRMVAWGPDGYRGVVFVSRSAPPAVSAPAPRLVGT